MNLIRMFRSSEPVETKWVARAYLLIILCFACGLASAVTYAYREAEQGRQRDAASAAQAAAKATETADARYSTCVNFNIEQWGDRESALNTALVTFGLAEPGDLSATDRAVIVAGQPSELQARYAGLEQQAAINNPYRDCSPKGIAAHYEHPPSDPAVIAPPPD